MSTHLLFMVFESNVKGLKIASFNSFSDLQINYIKKTIESIYKSLSRFIGSILVFDILDLKWSNYFHIEKKFIHAKLTQSNIKHVFEHIIIYFKKHYVILLSRVSIHWFFLTPIKAFVLNGLDTVLPNIWSVRSNNCPNVDTH